MGDTTKPDSPVPATDAKEPDSLAASSPGAGKLLPPETFAAAPEVSLPYQESSPGLTPDLSYHSQPLEEEDNQDADSAYSDDLSSTASLTSSILKFRTVNGRQYHSEHGNSEYWCVKLKRSVTRNGPV
jgi:hypothetical protein